MSIPPTVVDMRFCFGMNLVMGMVESL